MTGAVSAKLANMVEAYRRDRYAVCESFLSQRDAMALRDEALAFYKKCPRRIPSTLPAEGQLCIRFRHGMSAAEQSLSGPLNELKRCFNSGSDGEEIGDFVGQYAVTEPGWYLQPHRDAYAPKNRFYCATLRVSLTLYLNKEWTESDGGYLRILDTGRKNFAPVDIVPAWNTAVCLNSQFVMHEVLPPKRPRFSLTVWSLLNLEGVVGGPDILTI